MKFLVLGTSQLTRTFTEGLLDQGVEVVALITLPLGDRQLDSIDLKAFAQERGIAYHEFPTLESPEALEALRAFEPDYIFSSWPHLLREDLINLPRHFVIGSHPTSLPCNRGRHPLYWLISLGFDKTDLSFFVVDEKIDNGPIIAQISFSLPANCEIAAANQNMCEAARRGAYEVVSKLNNPQFVPQVQDATQVNLWRKRSIHDVTLDPRMSGDMILRTVRSFAPPYPGAILVWKEHVLRVARAEIDPGDFTDDQIQRMEHGRICASDSTSIHMKCDNTVVRLEFTLELPRELRTAKYIHPPAYYLAQTFNG